jgi:hypothetical protein
MLNGMFLDVNFGLLPFLCQAIMCKNANFPKEKWKICFLSGSHGQSVLSKSIILDFSFEKSQY